MSACTRSGSCVFYRTVEPSVVKRIKYASAFPYCKGDKHTECALFVRLESGEQVPHNLLPNDTLGDYMDSPSSAPANSAVMPSQIRRVFIVENSQIFVTLFSNAVRTYDPDIEIVECLSFEQAEQNIAMGAPDVIVCGFGLGDGMTAHDLRRLTSAPMVVLTGRPTEVQAPSCATVVSKSAGPDAIRRAIAACS